MPGPIQSAPDGQGRRSRKPGQADDRELFVDRGSLTFQGVKYLGVASTAAVVDVGSLWLLYSAIGLNHLLAAALAFGAGLVANFAMARRWVFGADGPPTTREFSGYWLIGLMGLGLTEAIMFLGVDVGGMPVMLTKLGALGIVFSWNFLMRRFVLYRSSLPSG
jgi:putative flippase GtrA